MWFAAWIIKGLPPYERDFDRKDPLIDHKHRPNQYATLDPLPTTSLCADVWYRISGDLNWTLAFIIPIGVTLVIGLIRRSAMEVHHSVLALYSGRSAIQFLSDHATYSYPRD